MYVTFTAGMDKLSYYCRKIQVSLTGHPVDGAVFALTLLKSRRRIISVDVSFFQILLNTGKRKKEIHLYSIDELSNYQPLKYLNY